MPARLEAMLEAATSIEAEAAVLAVVILTRGDAVKLEDAEVVCLLTKDIACFRLRLIMKIKNRIHNSVH